MIPDSDTESWERIDFLYEWYVKRFGVSPSTENTPLDIEEDSYEYLELLEKSFKKKAEIEYPKVNNEQILY
tara:strand:+ start:241 stop:453 length:213 start_codon:yes stop_codon:yes gene_type:complete